jgi:hypothetical protein
VGGADGFLSLILPRKSRPTFGVSALPEWRAVDSTIDAIGIFALGCTMLLPGSLISKQDIVVGGR